MKRSYGIVISDYEKMFLKQDGKCAICGQARYNRKGHLCIDHDHMTGEIRGLLCPPCNVMLGYYELAMGFKIEIDKYLLGEPNHASCNSSR